MSERIRVALRTGLVFAMAALLILFPLYIFLTGTAYRIQTLAGPLSFFLIAFGLDLVRSRRRPALGGIVLGLFTMLTAPTLAWLLGLFMTHNVRVDLLFSEIPAAARLLGRSLYWYAFAVGAVPAAFLGGLCARLRPPGRRAHASRVRSE